MVDGIVLTPRVAPRSADAKIQTVVFNDAPLKLFLHEFIDMTGITVELASGVDAAVTLHVLDEVTLSELQARMTAVLKSSGIALLPVTTNVLRAVQIESKLR